MSVQQLQRLSAQFNNNLKGCNKSAELRRERKREGEPHKKKGRGRGQTPSHLDSYPVLFFYFFLQIRALESFFCHFEGFYCEEQQNI